MQVQGMPGHPVKYPNALAAAKTIVKEEGLRALYRGWVSTCFKVAPSVGSTWLFYEWFKSTWGIEGIRHKYESFKKAD